jgi:hypothetical protein
MSGIEGQALSDVEIAREQLENVKSQTSVLLDIKTEITTVADALAVFNTDYTKYLGDENTVLSAEGELEKVNRLINSLLPEQPQYASVSEALDAFELALKDLGSAELQLGGVKEQIEPYIDVSDPCHYGC